ncbi:hypothetical protein [Lacrimispora sp.]
MKRAEAVGEYLTASARFNIGWKMGGDGGTIQICGMFYCNSQMKLRK